jgi:hypothetical protein
LTLALNRQCGFRHAPCHGRGCHIASIANTTAAVVDYAVPVDLAFGIDGRLLIVASCERQATGGDPRQKIG